MINLLFLYLFVCVVEKWWKVMKSDDTLWKVMKTVRSYIRPQLYTLSQHPISHQHPNATSLSSLRHGLRQNCLRRAYGTAWTTATPLWMLLQTSRERNTALDAPTDITRTQHRPINPFCVGHCFGHLFDTLGVGKQHDHLTLCFWRCHNARWRFIPTSELESHAAFPIPITCRTDLDMIILITSTCFFENWPSKKTNNCELLLLNYYCGLPGFIGLVTSLLHAQQHGELIVQSLQRRL